MLKNAFWVAGSSWRPILPAPGGDFEVILGPSGAPFLEKMCVFFDFVFYSDLQNDF